ncbi:hypothetical protein RJT34_16202 [Clitoria ternatea]|uniref:Uncharacterized protein n=1 Tax=Clitoria ternatea TaxID=43366 RepID=A0AAN9J7X5_CLITE
MAHETSTPPNSATTIPDPYHNQLFIELFQLYNEMQLEEVPEMDYNPLGSTLCGEICVRGKSVFAGDIGEMFPNGVVRIIDRKKNLVKLSQGEHIALEHLENVYGVTPIVEDIWVYGNSFKSMLVAVVVPNEEATNKTNMGDQDDFVISETGERFPSPPPPPPAVVSNLFNLSPQSRSQRRKNRSEVWDHFTKEPGAHKKARYNHCTILMNFEDVVSCQDSDLVLVDDD